MRDKFEATETTVKPGRPALIGIDWGTSSFRANLADADGSALVHMESDRGILSFAKGEHEAFLADALAAWRTSHAGLPIVMSGMIGARQGWIEAPYAQTPAGLNEVAAAIVTIDSRLLGPIWIVPGVSTVGAHETPDVMRGEETQILGALAASRQRSGVFVLPGTHSKWARVEGGRICSFKTYMTGEVFGALKNHTILGRLMVDQPKNADDGGFALGVEAASHLQRPGDLLHSIFMTRTLGLFDRLQPDQLSGYLSGLLIGAEIVAGAEDAKAGIVIGSPELAARYCKAGALLGLRLETGPNNCATAGQAALLASLRGKAT